LYIFFRILPAFQGSSILERAKCAKFKQQAQRSGGSFAGTLHVQSLAHRSLGSRHISTCRLHGRHFLRSHHFPSNQLATQTSLRTFPLQDASPSLDSTICNIILGATGVVGSILGGLTVSKTGTKRLLSISGLICFTCMLALSLSVKFIDPDEIESDDPKAWLPVIFVSLFVISYAAGPGPMPWALIGECFVSK